MINYISDSWTRIKNHCRTTVNKDFTENKPSSAFKKQLLISEHSPIRLLEIDWSWLNIPYWVSTEWARHKFEKFISTQRNDRVKDRIDRGEKPQNTPVRYDGYANAQNMIDAWRKRLCFQATPEARKLAEDLKIELKYHEKELSDVLVPNCVYRGGCPEFNECGYWSGFLKYCRDRDYQIDTIAQRYEAYNEFFMLNKKRR